MSTLPRLLQIFPSRADSARDVPSLASAMQNLALDAYSPVALELAATVNSRQFLLRAEDTVALKHVAGQLQARYPQAVLREVRGDPLKLAPSEECSGLELRPGAASYLPLRGWQRRELLEEGADPLLGILAAFGDLPTGTRAVIQIALLPASPTWSASQRRRAVEHPLAKEQAYQRQSTSASPSIRQAFVLFLLVGLVTLLARFHQIFVPPWALQAGATLAHGSLPHLTLGQSLSVIGVGLVCLFLGFCAVLVFSLWHSRFGHPPIYDQQLVEEKTSLPAYRVRVRLYVMTQSAIPLTGTTGGTVKAGEISWRERLQAIRAWLMQRTGKPFALSNGQKGQRRAQKKMYKAQRRAMREREQQRHDLLRMLAASYRQYHLATGGYFQSQHLSPRKVRTLLAPVRGWPRLCWWWSGWIVDVPQSTHILSIADLAALWHLPQAQDLADLSYVEQELTRTLLAPSPLTTPGTYRVGTSTHAGQTVPVFLPLSCFRQNMLVVASTGKGKSSLFFHLMRAFFAARVAKLHGTALEGIGGMVLIDPHGDLTEQVLGCVPTELEDEIVLIDLADLIGLIGLNPLDMSHGQDRDKVIDNLIQIIETLWRTSYGPRTENILEYACKTLAEANRTIVRRDPSHGAEAQFTLLDVLPLLRRHSFRHAIFELVEDQVLTDWWRHYYEALDARQQAEYTSSVLTKLSKFASTLTSRRLLGQPCSTVDLTMVIQEEKILLVNCASGEIGADLAALVGSVIVGLFQVALAEQARLAPDKRRRFLVLIDEFQALTGVNYQTMLAELRKYGGSFALATQSLSYLDNVDRTLRASVLANVEHIFAFAMAPDDARLLHLDGVEPEDILRLPDYTCYARIGLDGRRLPTFSLHLDPPISSNTVVQQRIQDLCRNRYARRVGDIDEQLLSIRARQHTMQPQQGREDPPEEGVQPTPKIGGTRNNRRRGKGGRNKDAQGEHLIHQMYHTDLLVSGGTGPEIRPTTPESQDREKSDDQHKREEEHNG